MHPYHHAVSSARRYGGSPEDYLAIHNWFDDTKRDLPDLRHRALRHHSEGIFLCEALFGVTITNSSGRAVPVRQLGEQHVQEDLGWIPTAADWWRHLKVQPWMVRSAARSRDLDSPGEPRCLVCHESLASCSCPSSTTTRHEENTRAPQDGASASLVPPL